MLSKTEFRIDAVLATFVRSASITIFFAQTLTVATTAGDFGWQPWRRMQLGWQFWMQLSELNAVLAVVCLITCLLLSALRSALCVVNCQRVWWCYCLCFATLALQIPVPSI